MPKPKVIHDVFTAIADPTRRRILELLASGPQSVTSIVDRFSISQPSISEHLRLLREAGIVQMTPSGRQRIYSMNAPSIRKLADWASMLAMNGHRDLSPLLTNRHMTMDID